MLFAFCRLLLRFGLRLALALVSCYRLRLCPPRPCSSPPGLCLVRPPRRPPSCKTSRTFLGHLFTVRACLHQPQLQHQLQVLHRHGHRHREEHGRDISGTCVRTGQRYTSGKAVEPGWVCSDKGLPYIWDQMKKMMATAKFFSAATPKFRGDFVVQKVSQEDAAFILAWLSDPSASKRAHSAVDLTADGLARPANCINDMRLASRASSRSNFLVLYCRCRLAVACAVGFEIVFCLPTS